MSQVTPKVTLITHTPDPDKVIAAAARLCYSNQDIETIMNSFTPESTEKFLNMLTSLGHESPFEHVSFTFCIEGVSRTLTHQLVRHRIASYSQKSQRYVSENQFEYVVPPEIKEGTSEYESFMDAMVGIQTVYNEIAASLTDTYIAKGMKPGDAKKKAAEDARFVLPGACGTSITVTMNVRTLWNFFHHRCCDRAQWEIRGVARQMLRLCRKAAPLLFKNAGPHCITGICPENKMQCERLKGKIPTEDEVRELIKLHYKKRMMSCGL